jgi:hypothetical protein
LVANQREAVSLSTFERPRKSWWPIAGSNNFKILGSYFKRPSCLTVRRTILGGRLCVYLYSNYLVRLICLQIEQKLEIVRRSKDPTIWSTWMDERAKFERSPTLLVSSVPWVWDNWSSGAFTECGATDRLRIRWPPKERSSSFLCSLEYGKVLPLRMEGRFPRGFEIDPVGNEWIN